MTWQKMGFFWLIAWNRGYLPRLFWSSFELRAQKPLMSVSLNGSYKIHARFRVPDFKFEALESIGLSWNLHPGWDPMHWPVKKSLYLAQILKNEISRQKLHIWKEENTEIFVITMVSIMESNFFWIFCKNKAPPTGISCQPEIPLGIGRH